MGLFKNTPNTIKLANAKEIKHKIILNGMILNWTVTQLSKYADYTLAAVLTALPQVVLQRVFTPLKPIIANKAKPAKISMPI